MPLDDFPVRFAIDDRFHRRFAVDALIQEMLLPRVDGGFCIGIQGPWGAGKSSMLQLIKHRLESEHAMNVRVVEFNPWNTRGTDQLLAAFMEHLASAMKPRGRRRQSVEKIGRKYLIALERAQLGTQGKLSTSANFARRFFSKSLDERRQVLKKDLSGHDKQYIVMIDDLDRIEQEDVFELFRLIRLITDLPRIVYVLAYDPEALDELVSQRFGKQSRFIEKIVQLQWSLPGSTEETRLSFLTAKMSEVVEGATCTYYLDTEVWSDTLLGVVLPLARTPRDVKRLALATRVALNQCRGQIDLGDLVALEAMRLFSPKVFSRLREDADLLTTPSYQVDEGKKRIEALLELAGDQADTIRRLIHFQFPVAEKLIGGPTYGDSFQRQWLEKRRVANRDVLLNYLSLQFEGDLLAEQSASQLIQMLGTKQKFLEQFLQIEERDLASVFSALRRSIPSMTSEELLLLMEFLIPKIGMVPKTSGTFLGLSPWSSLNFLMSEMFKNMLVNGYSIIDIEKVIQACSTLLERTFCLVALENLGDGPNEESSAEINALIARERAAIVSLPVEVLENETDISLVISFVRKDQSLEPMISGLLDNDKIAALFIASSIGRGHTTRSGSRFTREVKMVDLDRLAESFGGHDALLMRVNGLLNDGREHGVAVTEALEFVLKKLVNINSLDLED